MVPLELGLALDMVVVVLVLVLVLAVEDDDIEDIEFLELEVFRLSLLSMCSRGELMGVMRGS